MVAFNSKVRIQ